MNPRRIRGFCGRAAVLVLLTLTLAGCGIFEGSQSANPLIGTWTNTDNDHVTFKTDAVIITPKDGKPTPMGPGDCNGVFTIAYGRMETAPLQKLFPQPPDLEDKLKALLVQPEYPVAEVTCDRGGTTYLMLGERDVLAIYRDNGIGGLERLTRL
jgi:hypothetical protein